ncbi:hypothetical protein BO99DRAFT_28838 [Aspergillus violaceofuscus CBS 115571]|uniref:Uncharacterized protein n=1 Tax=Aspergillus violaceofuscus (strain CBS 115571) TaxID=1450538 RepID=A0A2V5I3J8_ASPV1|nr:hypothetical protein BO99DRAFT_28838 [Aspergillus violaceofuscus CBS 115571]
MHNLIIGSASQSYSFLSVRIHARSPWSARGFCSVLFGVFFVSVEFLAIVLCFCPFLFFFFFFAFSSSFPGIDCLWGRSQNSIDPINLFAGDPDTAVTCCISPAPTSSSYVLYLVRCSLYVQQFLILNIVITTTTTTTTTVIHNNNNNHIAFIPADTNSQ